MGKFYLFGEVPLIVNGLGGIKDICEKEAWPHDKRSIEKKWACNFLLNSLLLPPQTLCSYCKGTL